MGTFNNLEEPFKIDCVVEGSGNDTHPARVPFGGNSPVSFAGDENRFAAGGDSALFTPSVQAVGYAVTDVNRLISGVID